MTHISINNFDFAVIFVITPMRSSFFGSKLHMRMFRNMNRAKQVSNFLTCGANNVVEHYGKRIKILHGCPFEGWPNRARPSHTFWQKSADWLNWLCPVRSALKRTPMQDFNSFSIMFYYIISITYQKIGDLFCLVHISELSHSLL